MTSNVEKGPAGRGALAQVLATRGGRAAPEAPFVIEHREALIYMLCEAAELEHAIMCEYLFAAFSLKQSTDEGITRQQLRAVDRWRKTISQIAAQEMLHLALVQNLLSAVGAAPHLERPNLPQPAGHYPPGVILTLLPFGDAALRHFMFLERPEGMDLADAPGLAAVERAIPVMQEGEIVPRLQDFATIGHLYRSIEEGIKQLCVRYGEQWLFVGPVEAQASESHFGWPELVQVVDARSAQRAIDTILEQGEGPRGHWKRAHFGSFVDVLEDYQRHRDADPTFEPARPVLPATVRPSERTDSCSLIEDPYTARCADLFNVSYEVLLQILARYFAHTEETESQLATLAQVTLGLMRNVIKPLGQVITTLPIGGSATGRVAGPTFELFYESDYLLPHRDSAWALMEERIREAAAFADRLCHDGAPEVAVRIQPVGAALLRLAHTLGTSRSEWGGHDHAGQVTIAHRRRDAEAARTDREVSAAVDRLAAALRAALHAEQVLGLRALFSAAPVSTTSDPTPPDAKRSLVAESRRRFERMASLAELLVGVVGQTRIDPPDVAHVLGGSSWSPGELYEELKADLRAVQPGALLVDPRPAPTFAPEQQRHPLPGVVDLDSALALIDQIADDQTPIPDFEMPAPIAGPRPGQVPPIAQLFRDAHTILLAVLGSSVGDDGNVVAARHRLRDLSSQLHARVMRPLADALWQVDGDPVSSLAEAYRAAARHPLNLADRARALAVRATEVRTELEAAPPELLEATAGLQELALTFAVSDEADRAALLQQFRSVEAGLPRDIQLVKNGPYLLTNIERMTDGLGDPIPTGPQMALCRCGESDSKPWCDGSHAVSGFEDTKDPERVADQRDTYPGLSITVYDNRGICQHAGFCTVRVPAVFRAGKEPFVAPSGARMDEIIRAVRDCPSGALSYAIDNHEAREEVDWHLQRPPAVSVITDGPYRVTGGPPLIDSGGAPVARDEGVSLEHYALCRCGHSRNKPFCSGMHWYVQFRDPIPKPDHTPSLYEWCGGRLALGRMTRLLFERHVAEDDLLAPLFASAGPDQPDQMAEWLGEVLGGPPGDHRRPNAGDNLLVGNPTPDMGEPERTRLVTLLLRSAREVEMPTDPEFWSAFTACVEWLSLQGTADPAGVRWDWGPAGPPKPPLQPDTDTATAAVTVPGEGEQTSFARHIRPLFRPRDQQAMSFAFDLLSYDDVQRHATAILDRLRAGSMPCDGAWPDQQIDLFQRWVNEGTEP
jgi:CDGSH-type Zn-finger protein/truncated hemoglobin YjbI